MNKEQNLFKFNVWEQPAFGLFPLLYLTGKKAIAQTEQGMVQNESFPALIDCLLVMPN